MMSDPSQQGVPTRILVVDDDADIRTNFTDILCDLGYDAVMAENGESALGQIRQREFEVALLDYKMPDMNGATLYREMKKLRPSIDAVMVTAYAGTAGNDGAQLATQTGAYPVLAKPVDVDELLKLIADIVKRRRLHQQ